MSIYSFY
ncbi:hypothetical protein GQ607_017223 [Colletotrichum asianum]|nr:hypothetical protein GQ607_017223 [Colletotrichum asianum]